MRRRLPGRLAPIRSSSDKRFVEVACFMLQLFPDCLTNKFGLGHVGISEDMGPENLPEFPRDPCGNVDITLCHFLINNGYTNRKVLSYIDYYLHQCTTTFEPVTGRGSSQSFEFTVNATKP